MFTSLSSEGPKDGADIVGLHKITGGTGKYLGVEGDITARCTIQTQFQSVRLLQCGELYQAVNPEALIPDSRFDRNIATQL